ncbi:SDR family oxidoreductase [Streptomyces olivoreticuli]|uniref:SDR family oxidoreductase n=1 Tax=Streptomyces blastmyceticus TaxID=68180 RepID=A0ABP3H4V8_9ACTN|nr:SDR family oxidoreductase [Streptomyces olivoreticuli]WKK25794.1 SDR family oxidoreductase [Streptomyces olivoreticuli]
MLIDLTGRTALVTGSTAGIGLAIAEGLHASGATVILNGRTDERVAAAAEKFGTSERVRGVAADIGTAAGCQAVVEAEPEVDILVNNAGVFSPQPLFEIPDAEWERFFAVNVMSGIRLSRHYVPAMTKRQWGRTVFVSSESAVQIPPEMVHYGTTKTAQLAVARGMAEAVRGTGVTVNSVLPGPTASEGVERFVREMVGDEIESMEEAGRIFVERERPTSLLGRLASAEEVANLVVYLCSDQAAATTGAALRVDGGVLRGVL